MPAPLTTLPPPPEHATPHPSRHVLAAPGIAARLMTLAPTERIAGGDARAPHEHVLVVVEGGVAVARAGLTHLLKKADVLHLPAGSTFTLVGDAAGWTRLLWFTLAPRGENAPVLFNFPAE
jgi:glyoxylate utilization-related uncharacterized protein